MHMYIPYRRSRPHLHLLGPAGIPLLLQLDLLGLGGVQTSRDRPLGLRGQGPVGVGGPAPRLGVSMGPGPGVLSGL